MQLSRNMRLPTAKGVEFVEDKHEYWYRGKRLSGVTSVISDLMRLSYTSTRIDEARKEGTYVHSGIQKWVSGEKVETMNSSILWTVSALYDKYGEKDYVLFSEVLVSDKEKYASSIDLLAMFGGCCDIFDIKTGAINPQYLSWQLGIYKYFLEKYEGIEVHKTFCIAAKHRMIYTIKPESVKAVENLLYRW